MSNLKTNNPSVPGFDSLRVLAVAAMLTITGGASLGAQQALGLPFIGRNHVGFHSAEITKYGAGEEMTALFGAVYGRRFGNDTDRTRVTMAFRGSARALDDSLAGVMDLAATVGLSRDVRAVEGLSMALATGLGTTLWGDDATSTGRIVAAIPLTAGLAYDLHVRSATLAPFVAPSVTYYRARAYVDDVRTNRDDGWDAQVTAGASIRFRETVLSASRIYGERGMPKHSRWTFSAGMSF